MTFYDGTKLLSLKDLDGNTPEIFISTSNRSAGKTTYFNRWVVNKWLKQNEKFCLLYRWKYEIMDVADKFFSEIKRLFFPEWEMSEKYNTDAGFTYLYLKHDSWEEPVCCGYAISINTSDQLKKYSHLLADTMRILFDEFQTETGAYAPKEIIKFNSIHTSIARGNGKQVRYVPVIMISNPITILNPYYTALGITERISEDTKYMRGHGWVLEQGYNESSAKAQSESAFNKAFASNSYLQYSAQGKYLLDNSAFIEKMNGKFLYLCTLKYNDKHYAVKEYTDKGILYCDDCPDMSFPIKFAVDTESHEINHIMLKRNSLTISNMRNIFEAGCFRFKNVECKDVILKMISYY